MESIPGVSPGINLAHDSLSDQDPGNDIVTDLLPVLVQQGHALLRARQGVVPAI